MTTINFDDAILAHSRWKTRLKNLANGTSAEKVDIDALAKDNQCELGKWLEDGGNLLKSDPDYKALLANHSEFHKAAAQLARLAESGKRKEALEALGGIASPFTRASTKVISLITSLRKRIA